MVEKPRGGTVHSIEEARRALQELLNRYHKYKDDKSFTGNEKQACASLIIPLINKILHWNVEDPSEFKAEESQSGKRIDYVIYNQGISQFIVEAKAPSKDIFDNNDYYKQALEYGYGKEHDFAILTNFKQIVILGCQIKFRVVKETEIARIDLINATEEDFNLLLNFEKERWIGLGKDNPLYSKLSRHTKTISVDEQLLEDMKHWREQLLRNIKANSCDNKFDFEDEDEFMHVEEEVQKIIDRLIFICYCEDKELKEPQLKRLMFDKKERFEFKPGYLLGKMIDLFAEYRRDYNSDLFDKSECDDFKIDDTVFLEILSDLREPKERVPYDFKSIEADILGKTYENFIGHVQKGKKRFTEQEDKGKRKKEGIYYTPKYIVDYIVNNTVREYIKGKSFEEILKVKILDPACGSGSFLLRSFDVLMEESVRALKRELTYDEKKKLMLSCIHGVDLDKRACDIAKLNLSLKLAWREKLPVLRENIRKGNSLIDDSSIAGYNAFVWEEEFKEIMSHGGFDMVVGNPPYIFARSNMFSEEEKQYYYNTFSLAQYQLNTYLLFVEKAINLLKLKGKFGFIIPNTWQTIDNFSKFRSYLFNGMDNITIINITDKIFSDANVDTSVLVFRKNKLGNKKVNLLCFNNSNLQPVFEGDSVDFGEKQIVRFSKSSFKEDNKIVSKIEDSSVRIEEISTVKAGLKAYEVGKGNPKQTIAMKDKRIYHADKQIDKTYYRYLEGRDVCRYLLKWGGHFLKYGDCLAAPRKFLLFNSERILVRQIPSKPPYCINAVFTNEVYLNDINSMIIYVFNNYNPKFILGILNTKLISYWFNMKFNKLQRGLFPQFKVKELEQFPIPKKISDNVTSTLIKLVDHMLLLKKQLSEAKTDKDKIQREIEKTDEEIDELVYKLYGITEEEKKIIEESLK